MFKWFVKRQLAAFGRKWGYDTSYMQEIVDEAGVSAVMPMQALAKIGRLPEERAVGNLLRRRPHGRQGGRLRPLHSTRRLNRRIGRTRPENHPRDPRKRLRQPFERSTARRRASARRHRPRHVGRRSASRNFSAAGAAPDSSRSPTRWSPRRSYPTFKYAIGHGHTCVRVRVGEESVAVRHLEYA